MAVDTRDKRSSAIHLGLPWRGMLPLPDGALSQADRQHVAWLYGGILAGEAEVVTGPGGWSVGWVYCPGAARAKVFVGTPIVGGVYVPGASKAKVI